MIALRLHRALYDGAALDEATAAFAGHGTFERADEDSHWIVRVTAKDGASSERERRLAGELANWTLGLTVRRARSVAPLKGDGR